MRQIKFTHTGHSAHPLVGNFSADDTARLPADIATHLVEEAMCAVYIDQPAAAHVGSDASKQKQQAEKAQDKKGAKK